VQLDDTITRANLAIVTKGLDELAARKARLEAERDAAESVTFPRMLLAHADDAPSPLRSPTSASCSSCAATPGSGQKAQLRQRITQLQDEISGLNAQQEAKAREISLIGKELDGVRELWKNNLVQITRLTALERDAARLEGERAQLIAAVAQTKGKISETELQIIQIDQDLSSEVAKDMREVDAKYGEFVERKVAAETSSNASTSVRHKTASCLSQSSHRRRRDSGRRCDHADRAGIRQPAGRSQDQSARHRPDTGRPTGNAALLRVQSAHDT
jgi:HlyD family secretion protein